MTLSESAMSWWMGESEASFATMVAAKEEAMLILRGGVSGIGG